MFLPKPFCFSVFEVLLISVEGSLLPCSCLGNMWEPEAIMIW